MKYMYTVILSFIFLGCVKGHNYQMTINNKKIDKIIKAENIFLKVKRCFTSKSRTILFEQPLNKNYKKIRIYYESHNFYKLAGVITVFENNYNSIYITEDLSANLKLSNWVENNMECSNVQ